MKKLLYRFWPILCVMSLWIAFASPYLFKSKVPFPSSYLVTFFPPWNATYGEPVKNNAMPDVISQIYPWKKITLETWKNGQIPLWNPYSFSGTVHAGNYQSAVFSPFNLLFFIFPFVDAWSVLILLQPFLAGVGMYLMMRSFSASKQASLISAFAFMFCGFMTTWMAYGTLGYAALYLPWLFWAVTRDLKNPSWGNRVLIPVFVTVSLLSGHFQISLYLIAAALGYIVTEAVRLKKFRQGIILAIYVLFGIGLAAPQILLTFDAYSASERSNSFIKGEIIPWNYMVTLISPDFYGNPVTRNDWFGHYAEWSSYIGVVPLLLAIISIVSGKNGRKKYFISLSIISFLLAYPTPASDILFRLRLPAISTSAASRIMILFSFSLAALSAFGMDELSAVWKSGRWKRLIYFFVTAGLTIAGIWFILFIFRPFPADKIIIARRNLLLPSLLAAVTCAVCFAGLIKKKNVATIAVVILISLTGLDLMRYASKWMPFDTRQDVYPRVASLEYLRDKTGFNRVFGNIGNESGGMYSLPLIEGYDAVYQGRYGTFMQAVSTGSLKPGGRSVVQFDKHGLYRTEALQLLGVKYIYHRKSDGRNVWAFPYWEYTDSGTMRQVYSDNDFWIYEYTDAYPRAYLASGYRVAGSDNEIIKMLFSPDTNRRETLILESEPDIVPERGDGTVSIALYTPVRVEIQTESSVPKLLFLSDVYDDGWHAYIDGRKTKIQRADFDFRSVAVPAGKHTITYTYFPDSFRSGGIIAVLAGLCIVLLSVFQKKYENRIP